MPCVTGVPARTPPNWVIQLPALLLQTGKPRPRESERLLEFPEQLSSSCMIVPHQICFHTGMLGVMAAPWGRDGGGAGPGLTPDRHTKRSRRGSLRPSPRAATRPAPFYLSTYWASTGLCSSQQGILWRKQFEDPCPGWAPGVPWPGNPTAPRQEHVDVSKLAKARGPLITRRHPGRQPASRSRLPDFRVRSLSKPATRVT